MTAHQIGILVSIAMLDGCGSPAPGAPDVDASGHLGDGSTDGGPVLPVADGGADAATSTGCATGGSCDGGTTTRTLKANYGHYFATREADTPEDAAALCEQDGVTGVNFRQEWFEVEPSEGVYDFSGFDAVLDAIARFEQPRLSALPLRHVPELCELREREPLPRVPARRALRCELEQRRVQHALHVLHVG